ncbi:putative sporulation protein YtxC [Desulfosporosinus meridiei]|uniref:YtxC-like family protein n=1 Tax=Desulfosporosinus meridiei (strain ATCC BAA-275 / DSM 13257 / KCTC 12902 / NCIMB 13706 / S10) TaxID=768704 RepID=J7ISW2_DESMD|nr:putative sporulation protein YtxC [Desulfosporosinus meridiei]AFQ42208.1 YtxC-like family protein [Desulfosporosinus meridiei DSM 13257]
MEHSVQLGTQYYRESICARLQELQDQEELPFQIIEHQQGKRWVIECQFQDSSLDTMENEEMVQKIHRYYLANALAETILLHWEKDHVVKILKKRPDLKQDNWKMLLNKALNYLNKGLGQVRGNRVNRKTSLVTQILNCLDDSSVFDIEGFLRFRASDYKNEVNKAVEFAIEEYIVEREYIEFIELLKHFVDSQKPRLECLHVGMTPQGKFHLYNDEGVKVTHQFLEDYQLDNIHELGYEDLLVSALIAVAPREITLHIRYEGYKDTLETIRKVFGDRVHDCQGCALCEKF